MIYSPGIAVYIQTVKSGTLDVSDDIKDFQLVRRSDGVSTFNCTLQNTRRKYDNIFTPNDRIVVLLKRLTWLREFTGYLNGVPLLSVWPRPVSLSASCSLKRLQYWFWDSALPASEYLVRQALQNPATRDEADGGLKNAALAVLDKVVGWTPDKVHISQIPPDWLTWSSEILKEVMGPLNQADEAIAAAQALVGSNGSVSGAAATGQATGTLPAGTYGNESWTDKQCGYAEQIYNAGVSIGASQRDITVALMTAMQESTLLMYANSKIPDSLAIPHDNVGSDGYSVGLFQQQTGPVFGTSTWGTVAQCMDPTYSAKSFFKVLLKLGNRDSMALTQECQAVQHSAYPDAYAKWQPAATAMVEKIAAAVGQKQDSTSPGMQSTASGGSASSASVTGAQYAQTGVNLVTQHPNIPYVEGGDSVPSTAPAVVKQLDCSSFVQWVTQHALGTLNGLPRIASDQAKYCQAQGQGLLNNPAQGLRIPGALMFFSTNNSPDGVAHVGISIGDGQHTVEFSHSGTTGHVITNTQWTYYGLLPGISYTANGGGVAVGGTGAATTTLPNGGTLTLPQTVTAPDVPVGSNDPIDQMFNGFAWQPSGDDAATARAQYLTGVLALMNDEPLLPYIKSLMNSSMRSFSSGPNGDFIAWFPDYYGLWGTAAIMDVRGIEVKDFTIDWSDDYFVTHQFVTPANSSTFSLTSGNLSSFGIERDSIPVTIENPAIMKALFGLDPTSTDTARFTNFILNRFGARPDYQQLQGIYGPKSSFFMGLFLFMRQWAYQYNADIPLTFMPELWPGMLIRFKEYGFQAYVTTVTHTGSFDDGAGFSTTVNIAAPSRLAGSSDVLMGLPMAASASGLPATSSFDYRAISNLNKLSDPRFAG